MEVGIEVWDESSLRARPGESSIRAGGWTSCIKRCSPAICQSSGWRTAVMLHHMIV